MRWSNDPGQSLVYRILPDQYHQCLARFGGGPSLLRLRALADRCLTFPVSPHLPDIREGIHALTRAEIGRSNEMGLAFQRQSRALK